VRLTERSVYRSDELPGVEAKLIIGLCVDCRSLDGSRPRRVHRRPVDYNS